MSVRPEVQALVRLGPLPASEAADEASLTRYQALLEQISPPVTIEEAVLLTRMFGPRRVLWARLVTGAFDRNLPRAAVADAPSRLIE